MPDSALACGVKLSLSGIECLITRPLTKTDALIVAIPDGFEAGQIVEQTRAASPGLSSSRAAIRMPRPST